MGKTRLLAPAGAEDIFAVLTTVKKFIRREIPGILGLDPEIPLQVEMPLKGKNSIVLIVTAEGQKVLLRAYPLSHRKQAEAHVHAMNLLAGHGVRVPKLLPSRAAEKYDACFVVEEFIAGETRLAEDLTDDNVKAMALQLARLHTMHSRKWGALSAVRSDGFVASFLRGIGREAGILQRRKLLSSEQAGQIYEWFSRQKPLLEQGPEYSLTHNDLHPANGLFQADGEYVLIDVDKLYWGHAAREVLQAYYRLLRGDPEKMEVFDEAYFSVLSPEDREATRLLLPVYEAEFKLSSAVRYSTRVARLRDQHKPHLERAKASVEELLLMIGS